MDFDRLKIFEGKFWNVFLHQDQTAIGRIYFWYKNEIKDFLEIPKEALMEFYELGNKIRHALNKIFKPDLYNYLSLNNITKHLHVHMIPRYSKKIEFAGMTFGDFYFGKSYKRNPEFEVNEETLVKIKNKIKETASRT